MREPQSNQYGLDLFYLGNLRKCVWLLTALVVGSCTHDVTEIEDTAVVKVAVSSKTQARKAELDRMAAFRKKQSYDQTDVWHRFKTDDGQKIDCVDFYAQPAFKLVNGIGRMPPTPPDPVSNDGIDIEVIPELDTAPTLDEDGREQRCPEGSVPIPRWELKDLARFEKLNEYLRKPSVEAPNTNVDSRALDSTVVCGDNHCHAVAGQDLQNLGAETMINIWKPFVEDPEMEFSLSQLWLVRSGQRL
jgi:hypothetical protein